MPMISGISKENAAGDGEAGRLWVNQPDGQSNFYSDPALHFTIARTRSPGIRNYLQTDAYSAAKAFVQGEFDIHGDIFAAIRYFTHQHHPALPQFFHSGLARLGHLRTSFLFGGRKQAAEKIQFHYDRSNEFYAQFLDSRMVYSAAYFRDPEDSLETAQRRKLDAICEDLMLHSGDTLLDLGCGWGGLVIHAGEHFGVKAVGCTLARQQLSFAQNTVKERRLDECVAIKLCDYRELDGCYDKIASVGMFEHVGRRRLAGYFRKTFDLLKPGGLFLNRGVIRPQGVCDDSETLFLQNDVFPGGELVHLDEVVREGERAGFQVVGLRNLARDYALTCKAWVNNLRKNAPRCRALVGDRAYRTWLLYLAASAVGFEDGGTAAAQVLFQRPRT
jgi:cyclopropane-fatty-acyl-phospholipid synthase